jgi:AraC-like DNA-binding protein
MKTLPLTEVGMFGPFVAFLEEFGIPVNRVLDRTNVSREMVDHGRGQVTKLQFYQFLETGGRGEGLPDLGYRIGERHGMRFVGPVGSSVLRAATLKDAVDTLATHLRVWLDGNHLWLERNGKHVWLCNQARDGLQNMQATSNQCAIMTLISLVREVAGPGWRPEMIRLDSIALEFHREFEALANAEVETIQLGVGVRFPAEFLSRPLAIEGQIESGAGLPSASDSPPSFAAAFEKTLRDQLPYLGVPTIPQAAEIAGTPVRSLQRHLGGDGLTYQRLIDRVRFQLAQDRLREDPNLTTRELAADLHFSSPSSFVRSFRRIAGVTPGAYANSMRT